MSIVKIFERAFCIANFQLIFIKINCLIRVSLFIMKYFHPFIVYSMDSTKKNINFIDYNLHFINDPKGKANFKLLDFDIHVIIIIIIISIIVVTIKGGKNLVNY